MEVSDYIKKQNIIKITGFDEVFYKYINKRFKDIIEIKKGINNIFDKDSISYKVSDNEPLDIIKLNRLCFKEVRKKILDLLEKEC